MPRHVGSEEARGEDGTSPAEPVERRRTIAHIKLVPRPVALESKLVLELVGGMNGG